MLPSRRWLAAARSHLRLTAPAADSVFRWATPVVATAAGLAAGTAVLCDGDSAAPRVGGDAPGGNAQFQATVQGKKCKSRACAMAAELLAAGPPTAAPGQPPLSMMEQLLMNSAPNRESLGQSTWTLLHAIAATLPDEPTPEQSEAVRNLVYALTVLYPCEDCRVDFVEEVKRSPPPVHSGEAFSMWLCQQHNIVNTKLDKPEWDCKPRLLKARWAGVHE